jgi:hypothetical protein
MRQASLITCLAFGWLLAGPAAAQPDAADAEPVADAEPTTRSLARRALPDYDGRPGAPRSPEDVALDFPRLLLAPFYFLVEHVVRRPLALLLTTAEREQWDIFRYLPISDDPLPWGVVPTAFIDFGFLPSIGIYAWFDHALVRDNYFSAQIAFGGPEWLRGTIVDRFPIGEAAVMQFTVDAWQRPDYLFLGIGSFARPDEVARYGRRFVDGTTEIRIRPYRSSQVRVMVGVSANEFYDTFAFEDDEVALRDGVSRGFFQGEIPPGFDDGYAAYRQRLELAFDSRQRPPESTSGVRVEAHGELGIDLIRPLDRRWVRWGGSAGGYLEIDSGRTLGVWGSVELASTLGTEPVPFTELPDLGVMGRMPGFRNGWVLGQSALAFGVDYAFPIAPWLDGFIAVSTGAAYGPHFEAFDAGLFRMSYALGVRAGSPDQPFVFQVGMGTAAFDDGAGPQVFRLTFGSQPGGL